MNDFSITELPEFDNHRCVMFIQDPETGLESFIAIHRGGLNAPSFGATRLWQYSQKTDALRDTLRLSRMMSYKAALAGLPYGGAKAVVMVDGNLDPERRRQLLSKYAERVNYFGGKFITGTDMGISQEDLKFMKEKSNFFIGLKIDPSHYTGIGLDASMKVCLESRFGDPSFKGKSFAIEGMGKIGHEILSRVYDEAEEIYVSDLKEQNIENAKKTYPRIQAIKAGELHKLQVDVYSPCGGPGALNSKTIPELKCKIIMGGANNQLENDQAGVALHDANILYAPDYVVNAGGMMSVVYEYEHEKISEPELEAKVLKIGNTLREIINESKASNRPTSKVADEKAEKIFANLI